MQYAAITRVLGVVLIIFSLFMLPPMGVEAHYRDGDMAAFIISFILTLGMGTLAYYLTRNTKQELQSRDGFLIVVLVWILLTFFGALPFIVATEPHISLTDAMFEAMSGLTTTGASILAHLNSLPHSILYYRQQLQFFGGMGIIVLTVAIIPMLGVGGMQLYRAETPGPMKESKLTPRITETAKALWYIYVGLNVACFLFFWLTGLNFFDAVGESFAAVSTGGFSIHDQSFAYYHNPFVYVVGIIFMWLGGTNFSLLFVALKRRTIKHFWQDSEFKAYILIHVAMALIASVVLLSHEVYRSFPHAFLESLFNVVSVGTTTGFVADQFAHWPTFVPVMIMISAIIGGCGASTSGGIKVIRALLLQKQTSREIKRLVHPHAVVPIKFAGQVLPQGILQSMWAFIAAFFMLYVILLMVLLGCGLDLTTAFGALTSAFANTGAGIGGVATGYESLSQFAKWVLIFAMLAGRLEVFSILVLFSRRFWQH